MNTPPRTLRTLNSVEGGVILDGLRWEYVAPPDACPVGAELHGRTFDTLDAALELLPGFEENPACTRRPCGCTVLPVSREASASP